MNNGKGERIYKAFMLVILTVAITFIITSITIYNKTGNTAIKYITTTDNISKNFRTFHDFIKENYIGEMNEEQMLEFALKGYVEGLEDEYSEYISKDEMEEYMEDTIGKYVGIGVYIANDTKTNQIIVLAPIKGSPAEEAGILPGDVITKVDGVEYKGEELNEASTALKSKEGTKANLEILRKEETLNVEVERKEIKVNHVKAKILENNIGYIQINSFDEGTYKEFKENWENLKNKDVKALIVDLRNNGGGIVDEALDIADMFVEKNKTLLITSSKDKTEEIEKAKEGKQIDVPTAILVNENTASASEILSASLKENNDKVKIVGKKTYGKGVIQTIFNLTDGSGLKLTTNEYFTPNHNVINKVGIKPDVEVELPEGKNAYTIEEKEDTQLQKAIEVVKEGSN